MIRYKIIKDSYYELLDNNSIFDESDICWHHNIKGIKIVNDQEYFDGFFDSELKNNKDYYLLYALYKTGDSLSEENNVFECIGLYENKNDALKMRNYILKNDNRSPLIIKNNKGNNEKIYAPWYGFYESLIDIKVEKVNLV